MILPPIFLPNIKIPVKVPSWPHTSMVFTTKINSLVVSNLDYNRKYRIIIKFVLNEH